MVLPCITPCLHAFCRACIEDVIDRDKAACPLCRSQLSKAALVNPPPPSAAEVKDEEVRIIPLDGELDSDVALIAYIPAWGPTWTWLDFKVSPRTRT